MMAMAGPQFSNLASDKFFEAPPLPYHGGAGCFVLNMEPLHLLDPLLADGGCSKRPNGFLAPSTFGKVDRLRTCGPQRPHIIDTEVSLFKKSSELLVSILWDNALMVARVLHAFRTCIGLPKDTIVIHEITTDRNRGPQRPHIIDTEVSLFKKSSELLVSTLWDNAIHMAAI
jgi:hypothetical protein